MGGSKSDKQKNALESDSPGALFPRLHVKETRNNGPRAPPRNKMALYEQFTVPSHRFQQSVQPQQQNPSVMPQQPFIPQTFTGPYYLPYYMTGFRPMGMMPVPSNVEEGELQQVPAAYAGENTNRMARVPSLQSKGSGNLNKISREDQEDFTVPTYASKSKAKEHQTVNTSVGNSTLSSAGNSEGTRRQVQLCTGGGSTSRQSSDEQNRRSTSGKSVQASRTPANIASQDVCTLQRYHSGSDSIESNEENGGIDNQSDEDQARRSSQEEGEGSDDSEVSVLENTSLPPISSKDIMNSVGDATFWKMRKAMQRQQNIFHKQVFELHRLTKVQHLMASAGLCDKEEEEQPSNNLEDTPGNDSKEAPETEAGKQAEPVIDVEEPSPSQATVQPVSAAETRSYDHRCYPPLPPPPNMGYYPGFPGVNQWYTPVPLPFPYQQPTPAVGMFSTPYGPVFGGPPPPMPFVQYSCEQRQEDPRYDMVQQVPSWQHPPHYFAMQWPGYVNSGSLQSSMGSFKENPAASSSQSHRANNRFQSQAGSSSPGSGLVREVGKAPERQQHQRQQQQHQRQQQQQQQQQLKLVGKYTEASQTTSSGNQRHGVSPYSKPSGFQAFTSETNAERGSRVTPKATLVTPESAAEILQSIRQERLDR